MIVMAVVPVGFKEAEKMLSGISKGYPKVAREAINKGLEKGKKTAVEAITKRYVMSTDKVKGGIHINKASLSKLAGNLDINGEMQPITKFPNRVSYVRGSWGPSRQVIRVTIIRGKPKILKGAFKLPSGRIMERRQPDRFPIFPVSTIGIAHMAGQKEVAAAIEKDMNTVMARTIKKNTEVALQKAGGKKVQ
jgi:hypothetical protein